MLRLLLQSRLFWKLFAAYAALTLLSAGWLALVLSERLRDRVHEPMIWNTAAVISVVVLAATGLIVASLIRRVATVTQAAEAFAAGDLDRRVPVGGRDELGQLAAALNTMSTEWAARIAELQRKSRQLQESGERLQTILGSMVEGVVSVDNAERILFANRAARAMLDFAGANPVGRPIWEAVRNPTIQDVVRTALEGQRHSALEFPIPRTQSTVALIAAPLSGNPCPGVVLVLHDVSELRRLENLRREFVSNVSHELKTPLASIQAYTETLLDGAVDDPNVNRHFLRNIEEQADRLHRLVLDMLRLARIESETDVFAVVPVGVEGPIAECLQAHAALAESKGVSLDRQPPSQPVSVKADPDALRTILDNLVGNAVKYTPAGGRVTVRWRAEDSTAVIQVADTGIGIARQHQGRVFERFYRVDKARSRDVGGTGLGLSIVKHLTQVFGGSVELESEINRGSTFTVRLPLA